MHPGMKRPRSPNFPGAEGEHGSRERTGHPQGMADIALRMREESSGSEGSPGASARRTPASAAGGASGAAAGAVHGGAPETTGRARDEVRYLSHWPKGGENRFDCKRVWTSEKPFPS